MKSKKGRVPNFRGLFFRGGLESLKTRTFCRNNWGTHPEGHPASTSEATCCLI